MSSDKQKIGDAGELLVAHYLASIGNTVYLPFGNARSDLVYEKEGTLTRVQVKTATCVKTGPYLYEQVRLNTRGVYNVGTGVYKNYKPYDISELDELWVVGTNMWAFPANLIVGRPSLSLRSSCAKPNKRKKDYDPEGHIVLQGTFEEPVRNVFAPK